jgi:hypothetical protein
VPRVASYSQDCGWSGPKARTVRSTNEQELSEVNRLRTPLEDRGWSARKARTIRTSHDLALFKQAFERIFELMKFEAMLVLMQMQPLDAL